MMGKGEGRLVIMYISAWHAMIQPLILSNRYSNEVTVIDKSKHSLVKLLVIILDTNISILYKNQWGELIMVR